MLDAYGWLMVLPNAISDILASIFGGHRFHGTKTRLFGWLKTKHSSGICSVNGMCVFSKISSHLLIAS